MLANEIEERGQISRKQQWDPTVDRALARMLLLPRTTAPNFSVAKICLAKTNASAYPLNVFYWGQNGRRADLSLCRFLRKMPAAGELRLI